MGSGSVYNDRYSAVLALLVFYNTSFKSEQCEIFAHSYATSSMNLGACLAYKNITCFNVHTIGTLDAAELRIGIATVTGRTLTFFVCHDCNSLRLLC